MGPFAKTLRIKFDDKVYVDLLVEKPQPTGLLNLAADAVASNVEMGEVETLELPQTLQDLIKNKIIDLKWANFDFKSKLVPVQIDTSYFIDLEAQSLVYCFRFI